MSVKHSPLNNLRVCFLASDSPRAKQVSELLAQHGALVDEVHSIHEVIEMLGAITPDMLLIDSQFTLGLRQLGEVVARSRARQTSRLSFVAISDNDQVAIRLFAKRAKVDKLIVKPRTPEVVIKHLEHLYTEQKEFPVRVLIVEDDESQALFAKSILRNAGMLARVCMNPMRVMQMIRELDPDVILMDLYMPNCDGAELTSLIRESDDFLDTPILFLSGEQDEDKCFEALAAGADDFLTKPIRPKHLISSVLSRSARSRAIRARRNRTPRDSQSGLYRSDYVIDCITASTSVPDLQGGLFHVSFKGLREVVEQNDFAQVEALHADIARKLVAQLPESCMVARKSDDVFFVLCRDTSRSHLSGIAEKIRQVFEESHFQVSDRRIQVRAFIGVAELGHPFESANELLARANQAVEQARGVAQGVHWWQDDQALSHEDEAALLRVFRNSLKLGRLEQQYQPIMPISSSGTGMFQALLRLKDEHGRMQPAHRLISLARKHQLLRGLDRETIRQATNAIQTYQRGGEQLRLVVPQSVESFRDVDYVRLFEEDLRIALIEPGQVIVDMPMSEVRSGLDHAIRFARDMNERRHALCLSDFEVSEANLTLLRTLPVQYLKLSARYLTVGAERETAEELAILIEVAHELGMQVIAYRIQDDKAAAHMWMSGIDYLQGNLIQEVAKEPVFNFEEHVI